MARCGSDPCVYCLLGVVAWQWNLQYINYDEDSLMHSSIMKLWGGMYDSFFQDRDEIKLKSNQARRPPPTHRPSIQ